MPSHFIDYETYAGVVCIPEMKEIFDEKKRLQRWLDFEGALAQTQGELGIIPKEAGIEIANKCNLDCLNMQDIRNEFLSARHSIVPLLKVLKRACEGDAGEYVHYGVTTQDVLDTAEVLEVRDALDVIYKDIRTLEESLMGIADMHKNTPIIGRTHGQQALPTTLGLKVAVWLAEVRRHINRLTALPERLFVGQLSGGVGNMSALEMAAFGKSSAEEVAKKTLARLGLKYPAISWHTARDNMGELASVLALITSTLGKIANEIYQLQKNEIGELAEPSSATATGSSTMPHKSNPTRCQRVVALSRHVRQLSSVVIESMLHEHERDPRCLNSEWMAVPEVCIYTGTAMRHMVNVISGLVVRPENMMKNLHTQKDVILSEWLLFTLGQKVGKMRAYESLRKLSKAAVANKKSLKETFAADEEFGSLVTAEELEYLDHPEKYIGCSVEIVENVLKNSKAQRANDPEKL